MRATRRRYWFELVLAVLAGALAVLTLISREWIEVVFGVDPDQGSGALEWLIVLAAVAVALASGCAALLERRRPATSPT
jgi:O-antigen/teichoic acid export membrane protein